MADNQLAELLKTQKSLTEWLQDIKHQDAAAIRTEDNDKRERLKVLNQLIGLPFDKPVQFSGQDLAEPSTKFKQYLANHGEELCALRLMPTQGDLPKLRMRGKPVHEAYDWFKQQKIDASKYRADFVPHPPDYGWATIFIVNKHGIQGEIIWGGHHQLTQGFHDNKAPIIFRYDFDKWMLHPADTKAQAHLEQLIKYLHVPDHKLQSKLQDQLKSSFAHNYLEGYFETTDSSLGIWFIDYSPTLGKLYADTIIQAPQTNPTALVSGQSGSTGEYTGPVKIVPPDELAGIDFPDGAVLVCPVTTPDYVPLMQKAGAIVTDQGGILSHAAIVARELKKPCIVGTATATTTLQNDQQILVDATKGIVTAKL